MKATVIGVQHKEGTFTNTAGKTYDFNNINLHCVTKNLEVTGESVEVLKVKSEHMGELIAQVGGDYKKLVGHVFDVSLGAYGKVVAIELVK